jgi:RimJ/RimL family protein N-acetyltransferase
MERRLSFFEEEPSVKLDSFRAVACTPPRELRRTLSTPADAGRSTYPRDLEHEVMLRGRACVFVRPVRADDEGRLGDLFARLSARTIYQRFLASVPRVRPEWIHAFANVDCDARLGIVAQPIASGAGELIALAQYEAVGDDAAEIAIVVRDDWQGRGLGTRLLLTTVEAAERRGRTHLQAWVDADNARMLRLLDRHTDIVARTVDSGVVELLFRRARPAGC